MSKRNKSKEGPLRLLPYTPPPSSRTPARISPPPPVIPPSNKDLAREGGWRGEGVLGRVVVDGRDEGGCSGANRAVVRLAGRKINALTSKKGLC